MNQIVAFNTRRRQRGRMLQSAFRSLIATPQSLGSVAPNGTSAQLTLPAGGRFSVACSAALQAEDITVSIGANDYEVVATAAGVKRKINAWGEKTEVLSITRGNRAFTGTLTVYLRDDVGGHRAIATVNLT